MASFNELSTRLQQARYRKTILSHLIEHIDEVFMAHGGDSPKNFLLTDEKLSVPQDMFESVSTDILAAEIQQLDQEINNVLETELVAPTDETKKSTKKAKEGA
jgi:hypothetical protein